MKMGEKIYNLRIKNNMTLEELGDRVGVGKSTVRKWEKGLIANMKRDKIAKLASALNVSPAYLMGWDNGESKYILPPLDLSSFGEKTKRIPILGTIAAGIPILAVENHDDYFEADQRIRADFALRVKGDSMIGANIYSGDIAFFKEQPQVESGEIGAFLIDGEATLKRFKEISDEIKLLEPENPNYKPILLNNGSEIRVLGKLTAVLNIRSK